MQMSGELSFKTDSGHKIKAGYEVPVEITGTTTDEAFFAALPEALQGLADALVKQLMGSINHAIGLEDTETTIRKEDS